MAATRTVAPGARMILVTDAGSEAVTVVSLRLMGRVEVQTAQGEKGIVPRSLLRWP